MVQPRVTFINKLEHEIDVYLKLSVLLNADDTVLMAENAINLQQQLNVFERILQNMETKSKCQ